MSETTTTRIDVTTYYPSDEVMSVITDVAVSDVPATLEIALVRGLRVEIETVVTVETRTPYEECPYTYAHTQYVCGRPHCRTS